MSTFKVNKAEFEYNNGDSWEVVDTRSGEVVRTCNKGGDAASFARYYEQELVKDENLWSKWEG